MNDYIAYYPNRYRAEKARVKGMEIVIKVEGGYTVMDYSTYRRWKKQK